MFSWCTTQISCCTNQNNVVSNLSSVPLPQPPITTTESPISRTSSQTTSVFNAKITPEKAPTRTPSKKTPQRVTRLAFSSTAVGGGSPPPIAPSTYQVFDQGVLLTPTGTRGIGLNNIPLTSISPSIPAKKSSRISNIAPGPSSVPVKRSSGTPPTSRVITPAPRVSTGASGISLSSMPPSSTPPSIPSKKTSRISNIAPGPSSPPVKKPSGTPPTSRLITPVPRVSTGASGISLSSIPPSSIPPLTIKKTAQRLPTSKFPLAISSSHSAKTPKPKTPKPKSPIRSNSPHPKKEIEEEFEYILAVFKGADVVTSAFKHSKEVNLPNFLETYKKEIEDAKPTGFAKCNLVLRKNGDLSFKCYS